MEDKYLRTKDAADYIGYKPGTLRIWRQRKQGPKYIKLGRAVRYRLSDLKRFMEER